MTFTGKSAVELLVELAERGVEIQAQERAGGEVLSYSAPTGAFSDDLRAAVTHHRDALLALLTHGRDVPARSPDDRREPFALTDLQEAYLVGEQDFYSHHAPAVLIHEYATTAEDCLDADLLEDALCRLRDAHDILRLEVLHDGTQRIREPAAARAASSRLLRIVDLTRLPPPAAEAEALRLREAIPADLPPLDAGEPMLVRLIRLPSGDRLQIAMRLIAFDGTTTQLFLDGITRCYADPQLRPDPGPLTYQDFVGAVLDRREGAEYEAATRYWQDRLADLPDIPALPIRNPSPSTEGEWRDPGVVGTTLRRLTTRLDAGEWSELRARSTRAGLPVGSALFALYVETLHRWSDGRAATVAVLAARRPASIPGSARLWGNCATTALVACEPVPGSFVDRARALRTRLFSDLRASAVSGVEVGRMRRRRHGDTAPPASVVFTSGLDLPGATRDGFILGIPGTVLVHSSISTPQVLLDQQVYEEDNQLVCNIDFAVDAWPDGVIEELHAYYDSRLRDLATTDAAWRSNAAPLPARLTAERHRANDTDRSFGTDPSGTASPGTLHGLVESAMRHHPAAPAVIAPGRALTYGELDTASGVLAQDLLAGGAAAGDIVGVLLPRGANQVVAVLGILRSGCAYLPLDSSWPDGRVATVLNHSGTTTVVTDAAGTTRAAALGERRVHRVDGPAGAQVPGSHSEQRPLPPVGPSAVAYVIYTSGSTGVPKGVVTCHAAAVNTVRDLLTRFGLDADDRVLAVSSLAFDLSVFDVFGLLAVGGAVVMPPDSGSPDPRSWADAVASAGVTVWNSVPALMDMLVTYLGSQERAELRSLRLVMLSGDWVPLPLVRSLREACPAASVISLGGATEAAIWSNWFDTIDLPDGWSTVPYGYPLANQRLHVLDRDLADAPTWVAGDLYLGGAGVARGYLGDPHRTAAAFLTHPRTGEPLYRTGDRARYRPGGLVEFLGRDDLQVKVNGFRIELGEIETCLVDAGAFRAVAAVDTTADAPRLAAFVVGVSDDDLPMLRTQLAERLPAYMVPALIQVVDALPLGANGKVDRAALVAGLRWTSGEPRPGSVAPRNSTERTLAAIWSELLGVSAISVTDDFFVMGGNSLSAVRLFRRIEAVLGRRLALPSLFLHGTIEAQARLVDSAEVTSDAEAADLVGAAEAASRCFVPIHPGAGDGWLFCIHPIGGDVLCYQELVEAVLRRLPSGIPAPHVYGVRAEGLLPGGMPRDLEEMARRYAHGVVRIAAGAPHLLGWSMGGVVALRVAELLAEAGRPVASLTVIDGFAGIPPDHPSVGAPSGRGDLVAAFLSDLAGGRDLHSACAGLEELASPARLHAAAERLTAAGLLTDLPDVADLDLLFRLYCEHRRMLIDHVPSSPLRSPHLPVPVLVRAHRTAGDEFAGLLPLAEIVDWPGTVLDLDENHYSIIRGAGAQRVADHVAAALRGAAVPVAAPTPVTPAASVPNLRPRPS